VEATVHSAGREWRGRTGSNKADQRLYGKDLIEQAGAIIVARNGGKPDCTLSTVRLSTGVKNHE